MLDALGLVHLNEQSFVHIVATMALGRNTRSVETFSVQVEGCWQLLIQVKKCLRARRIRARLPHYNILTELPETPQLLQIAHPEVFANAYPRFPDEGPAECPLDEVALVALRSLVASPALARIHQYSRDADHDATLTSQRDRGTPGHRLAGLQPISARRCAPRWSGYAPGHKRQHGPCAS